MTTLPPPTDWDAYYRKPATFAPLTRRITARQILRHVARFAGAAPGHIVELGGGNSAFLGALRARYPEARLTAIDSNAFGLARLEERMPGDARLTAVCADVLAPAARLNADVVFSVGLVEHFDPERTARAIRAHFHHAAPGGLVVITYPTPTWLYRIIRWAAERAGVWEFPDERPLSSAEVTTEVARHGRILDVRLNWPVVLTQGIVAARRRAGPCKIESIHVDS